MEVGAGISRRGAGSGGHEVVGRVGVVRVRAGLVRQGGVCGGEGREGRGRARYRQGGLRERKERRSGREEGGEGGGGGRGGGD